MTTSLVVIQIFVKVIQATSNITKFDQNSIKMLQCCFDFGGLKQTYAIELCRFAFKKSMCKTKAKYRLRLSEKT